MKRKAKAHWEGNLTSGNGNLSLQSKVLNETPYSYKTRFQNETGTNPEELLAAAHAGCFTMTVTAALAQNGLNAESLDTEATVELDLAALQINSIHFELAAKVTGLETAKFNEIVSYAKSNCIISKILNIPVTVNAVLV
jgi:lipoyl-dependent peroxiredoxin